MRLKNNNQDTQSKKSLVKIPIIKEDVDIKLTEDLTITLEHGDVLFAEASLQDTNIPTQAVVDEVADARQDQPPTSEADKVLSTDDSPEGKPSDAKIDEVDKAKDIDTNESGATNTPVKQEPNPDQTKK